MKTTIAMIAAAAALIMFGTAHAAPLPEAGPDEAGFSKQGLARLDDFFAREIAAKRVPGAVVAIARDGKLVYHKAHGLLDPDKGTPMSVDAIFALASMTKPMAAVAGLTLMEQGRLPLQAKLSDYYPGFADMKVGTMADGTLQLLPQATPIYIHDLYRHTSGLMYGGRPDSASPVAQQYPDGIAPAIEGDTQAFIDRINKLPLAHQPSTVFEYGFSIDVLGAVVEKVSEQRLGDYLAANVWQPLGMKDATFHPTDAQRPRLARPFANDPLTGKPQSIRLLDTPTRFDCGGACAFATVGDYLRFGQMLILAREAIELLEQLARILWFEGTKHGLRDREWMALRFLSRANRFSRTPSALASYVGTTRGTASFIIGELERLGYLERTRSAKDKRSVMLSVTQQGKKFLARDPVNVLVETIAVLDEDGKTRFRDTLRHLLDQSDAAEQRHHTDVCKRCIFLRQDRSAAEGRNTAEFNCRLFRAPIAETETELLCTSFEHHRR